MNHRSSIRKGHKKNVNCERKMFNNSRNKSSKKAELFFLFPRNAYIRLNICKLCNLLQKLGFSAKLLYFEK